MPEVVVQSKKGSFKVPEEKHFGDFDLPFQEGSLRGSEREEVGNLPAEIEVGKFVPLATLLRIEVEGRTFDVVNLPFGIYVPLGEVEEIRKDKEAYYKSDLTGKTLEEIKVRNGIDIQKVAEELIEFKELGLEELAEEDLETGQIIEELIEKAEKGELGVEDLKEKVPELWEKLGKRGILSIMPSLRDALKGVKKPKEVKEKLVPPLTLKDALNYKGVKKEAYHLSGIMIGTDKDGRVRIIYAPRRIDFNSSLQVLKQLNQNLLFKLANYAQGISEKRYKEDKEYREKVSQRLKEIAGLIEGKISKEVKTLIEKIVKGEEIRKNGQNLKEVIIKSYFKENPQDLLQIGSLLAKKDGRLFLRTKPTGYGYPLTDYSKVKKIAVVDVPRPIKVEGKLQIQKVPTVLSAFEEKNGKWKPLDLKTDFYSLKRGYPVFKALKGMLNAKSLAQVRALAGEGFENIKGLDAIEREVSKSKNAINYIEFIQYIRDVLSPFLYQKDQDLEKEYGSLEKALEEVKERIKKDPILFDFYKSYEKFLSMRQRLKTYDLSLYFERPKEAVKYLIAKGVIRKNEKGLYEVDRERAKVALPYIKQNFVKEGINAKLALMAVASTLNAKNLLTKPVPELGKENALTFASMIEEALFLKEIEGKKHFLKEAQLKEAQPKETKRETELAPEAEKAKPEAKEIKPEAEVDEWRIPSDEELKKDLEEFQKQEEELEEVIEEAIEQEVEKIEAEEEELEAFETLADELELDF